MKRGADLVNPSAGTQRRAIYSDPGVYAEEMERIFGRCWLFLCHASQVPNVGDYVRTFMGEDEVLVVRQQDRSVKAFLNTCTHRGNRLCRADRGNAKAFPCSYHGWSFAIDGTLAVAPLEQEVYFGELDKSRHPLVAVDKVAEYKGLVFGCFDAGAPSLDDYLGDARWYIDVAVDALPGGMQLVGAPQKVAMPVNWKFPVENVSGDGYHFGWTHAGAMQAVHSLDLGGLSPGNTGVNQDIAMSVAGLNGHSVLAALDGKSGYAFYPDPTLALAYLEENRAKVVERLGAFRGEKLWGSNINFTIFPNLQFLTGLNWLRIYHPRGPGKIEQWTWAVVEQAMPDSLKALILGNQTMTFGPAGLFDNDDGDNLASCTEQARGWRTRQMEVFTHMALGRSRCRPGLPGDIADGLVSEHNQRGFYRRWHEHMNASSWADVPQYNLNSLESQESAARANDREA